nr:hypothetical protein [Candidatus Sigynarchaeota archaeon]
MQSDVQDDAPQKFVIDTDCLNHLLAHPSGRIVLKNVIIAIPPTIFNDLPGKGQEILKKVARVEIVELDMDDKVYASKIVRKINQKKEYEDWYLQGRKLREIKHLGECEGAAIAKRLNVDFVMLDRNARAVIKIAFKHISVKTIDLVEFGRNILDESGNGNHSAEFENEMNKRLHRYSKKSV